MNRRVLAALGLIGALLVAVAPPALAQQASDEPAPVLQIRSVDSRNPAGVELAVVFDGPMAQLQSATITHNGTEITPSDVRSLAPSQAPLVISLDTSEAMAAGDALSQTKRALVEFVLSRPATQQIGLVEFGGGRTRVVQRPTIDRERLVEAIEGLSVRGTSVTSAGIRAAAQLLETTNDPHPNMVLIAAGPNVPGRVTVSQARGAMINIGGASWVIGLEGRGVNTSSMRQLVGVTGGSYFGTTNLDAVPTLLGDIADLLDSQYVVTYPSPTTSGPADLGFEVGNVRTDVSFVIGGQVAGAFALRAQEITPPAGVGFLRDNGYLIGLVLAVAAVLLAVYAIGSLISPSRSALDTALDAYTDPGPRVDHGEDVGMARTALVQQAVGLTERFARSQGFLAKVEGMLERANLPLRAAEAMFFYACAVLLLVVLAFTLTGGNVMGTVVVSLLFGLLPSAAVNFLAGRRQKKFVAMLPETLEMLAGTLRAGYSLMQGVEAVSREVSEPMGHELRRVVAEARLGRPLEESLDASAERMESADFRWAVMAIRIQREVGGNLAELLVTVADTMTQRERLRRDVDALTAEGRVSAMVLGLLPVGLGLFLYFANPDYMGVLFEETIGQIMLAGSIVLAGLGFLWMRKVIQIDV